MEEKGPSFFLEIQAGMVEELHEMLVKSFERHQAVKANGEIIMEGWDKKQEEMREMIDTTARRACRTLRHNLQMAEWNLHNFRKNIRDVLALYVEVNNMMKVEEKQAAKQDAFIALCEESNKELVELKDSIKTTQALFPLQNPGVVLSRTNLSTEKLLNHIEEPYRPCETEVATAVRRVNDEMRTLAMEIPLARKLPKLTAPIEAKGLKVAEMMLKEFPPKTIDDFLNTLPPKQRD